MKIMFDDLTDEAQARLLRMAGVSSPEEMNWDAIPVAEVELPEDMEGVHDEDDYDFVYGTDEDTCSDDYDYSDY